jgi:hypothetical protein
MNQSQKLAVMFSQPGSDHITGSPERGKVCGEGVDLGFGGLAFNRHRKPIVAGDGVID